MKEYIIYTHKNNNKRLVVHRITYKGNLKLISTIDGLIPRRHSFTGNHERLDQFLFILKVLSSLYIEQGDRL